MTRRTEPLSARRAPAPTNDIAEDELREIVLETGPPRAAQAGNTVGAPVRTATAEELAATSDRVERLREGVRTLKVGGASLNLSERTLMVAGGIVAPIGVLLVFLGWYGASHTPYLFEQIPYLISGGLLGIGLIFLGAFFYFAHWVTQLVKEHRVQSTAVVEAIGRLEEAIRQQAFAMPPSVAPGAAPLELSPAVGTNGEDAASAILLVATSRGTMAHRPECIVVAGKSGLRAVSVDDGLAPCRLCDPYAELDAAEAIR